MGKKGHKKKSCDKSAGGPWKSAGRPYRYGVLVGDFEFYADYVRDCSKGDMHGIEFLRFSVDWNTLEAHSKVMGHSYILHDYMSELTPKDFETQWAVPRIEEVGADVI